MRRGITLVLALGVALGAFAADVGVASAGKAISAYTPLGPTQIGSADGKVGYLVKPRGYQTEVTRVRSSSGAILRRVVLPGQLTVPKVARDGSTTGLSADDRTLVLARPATGPYDSITQLTILDARTLRVQRSVTLHGSFSVDAISPDGAWLYLIQHTSPRNPDQYVVRAYDVRQDRLLQRPIIDPQDRGEEMVGSPVARILSPGGRWAYTLYNGDKTPPFIHALDTSGRRAVCVELDSLNLPTKLSRLNLGLSGGGRTLTLQRGSATVGAVDTRTFAVAATPAELAADENHTGGGDGSVRWDLVAIGAASLLIAGTGITLARRKRRPAAT